MSAFNAAVLSSDRNVVFSPFAFELDCVVVSEAFDPVGKSRYIDALGALVGFDNIYRPILERYEAARTNDFRLISARAFMAPTLLNISNEYRIAVMNGYGVQCCPLKPSPEGAECYLKAAMDGDMEYFRLPRKVVEGGGTYYVDLESLRVPPPSASPVAALWRTERFEMLTLQLADDSRIFVVRPADGVALDDVRGDFAAENFNLAVTVLGSITEDGVYHGPVDVDIPAFSIRSSVNLVPAFNASKLPLRGFRDIIINGNGPLADIRQCARFSFRGYRGRTAAVEGIPAPASVPSFACDRPVLFFIFHEPTRTVPVAGIYAGGAKR